MFCETSDMRVECNFVKVITTIKVIAVFYCANTETMTLHKIYKNNFSINIIYLYYWGICESGLIPFCHERCNNLCTDLYLIYGNSYVRFQKDFSHSSLNYLREICSLLQSCHWLHHTYECSDAPYYSDISILWLMASHQEPKYLCHFFHFQASL
jgi:hypothetical protein